MKYRNASDFRDHPSPDTLLLHLDGELHPEEAAQVGEHLKQCWTCRTYADQLDRGVRRFVEQRKEVIQFRMPAPPSGWQGFSLRLHAAAQEYPTTNKPIPCLLAALEALPRRLRCAARDSDVVPSRIFLTSVFVRCCAAMIQDTWNQHRPRLLSAVVAIAMASLLVILPAINPPAISAAVFLERARASRRSTLSRPARAEIYQRVEIRHGGRVVTRELFHELAQPARLQPESARDLRDLFRKAGLDWDNPLSADRFSAWRETVPRREDRIFESPNSFTLRTTPLPRNGDEVRYASLTVNRSDWRPIAEHVEFTGKPPLDVTEVAFDLRELRSATETSRVTMANVTPQPGGLSDSAVHAHHLLSGLELDEAELEARLVLHHLHADTGEQIRLSRASNRIEVKGVVDTKLRRQALTSSISQLRDVQALIVSVEDLSTRSGSPVGGPPIHVYSVESHPSPLEQYMREKIGPVDQLTAISHSLLDDCLTINQAAVHLSELQLLFQGARELPADLQNQLAALSLDYVNTIDSGLDANQGILHSLDLENPDLAGVTPPSGSPDQEMDQHVRRYQELCQELITGGTGESRSAAAIANDLMSASAGTRFAVAQMTAVIQRFTK